MMKNNRLNRENSILFICDVQEKFLPHVYKPDAVVEAAQLMVRSAIELNLPIIATQHSKKVMGEIHPSIKQHLSDKQDSNHHIIVKTKFSMITEQTDTILNKYKERKNILLLGLETQVCILQTFLDLKDRGYQVWALIDGISSIRDWQRSIALKRLQKQGAIFSSFESAIFQILQDTKDEKFKPILSLIKQTKREKAINHL